MRLALDHHYSPVIAERLRRSGLDAVAVSERDWHAEDDEPLLTLLASERRALLTNNVADFDAIARRWQAEGRAHWGLVFTSDSSMPRTRATIGAYTGALEVLMRAHPGEDSHVDRVHWLTRPSAAG